MVWYGLSVHGYAIPDGTVVHSGQLGRPLSSLMHLHFALFLFSYSSFAVLGHINVVAEVAYIRAPQAWRMGSRGLKRKP